MWDMDGTLIESRTSIRETMNTVLAEEGLATFSRQELDALIGHPLRDILARKCSDEAVIERMTQRYRVVYNESGWVTAHLFEGLEALLESLHARGVKQAVVTSKGQHEAEILLQDLGLSHLFSIVIGDDDARPLKPDPAPVRDACKAAGTPTQNGIMIGDTTFDIRSAVAAGATAVGVGWGIHEPPRLREAGAHYLVRTVSELEALLGRLL